MFTATFFNQCNRLTLVAAVVTALLSACGGGGGGGTATPVGTPSSFSATCSDGTTKNSPTSLAAAQALCPTNPTSYTAVCSDGTTRSSTLGQAAAQALCPQVSTIVNAALPVVSTYASNGLTEEAAAFNLLNQERSRCGFGTLTQNASLDKAAKAHADWQIINNIISHNETSETTGFTGINPLNRAVAAGYPNAQIADNFTSYSFVTNKSGLGASTIRGLLNAPYHAISILYGYRDVGISIRIGSDNGTSNNLGIGQLDLGAPVTTGLTQQASADVLTYPCQGTTGTDRQLTGESPNPVPGRNLATSPLGGIVVIQLRSGNTLSIEKSSFIQVSNGADVAIRSAVTGTTDANLPINQGYIAADAPLLANTSYQVTINGTNNGTPFSRTFTFTTGTGG